MKRNIMKNRQNIMTTMLLTLLLSMSGHGQSYFSGFGLLQNNTYDARSAGMGLSRTAIDQGAWSVTGNPAHLANTKGPSVSFTMLSRQVSENRSIDAIDQFSDVVTKNVYAANTHTHSNYAMALNYGFKQLTFAYAWTPVHDFAYAYSEEVRNSLSSGYYNRDLIAGYHTLDMKGQIYGHYLGVSSKIKGFAIGFNVVTYADRDISILKKVSVLSEDNALASDTSYAHLSSYAIESSGVGFNLGLSYDVTQHMALHYVLEKTGDLSLNSDGLVPFADSERFYPDYYQPDSNIVFTIRTPLAHRMGISFSPGQKHKTIASFEMELHEGQTIEYSDDVNGLDEFDYRLEHYSAFHVGLEHWASPSLPIRFGYSYEESPIDKALTITRFTLGGSLIVKQIQFDMAGSMSSVGYTYPDLFPTVLKADFPDIESVNESVLNLYVTASYRLP